MITLKKGINVKFVDENSSLLNTLKTMGWSEEVLTEDALITTKKKGLKDGISSTTGS